MAVTADWMACNDTNCVTGDKDFSIKVGGAAEAAGAAKAAAGRSRLRRRLRRAVRVGYILSAIGWALVALLTPCVFPMIPMTVSFFLKGFGLGRCGRFRALMYGLFIVLFLYGAHRHHNTHNVARRR